MNDPAFFDASRGLARRILAEGGADERGRIAYGFRLCTSRKPATAEVDLLEQALRQEREHFQKDQAAAKGVLKGSDLPQDLPEAAAWTLIANVLINLDETVTKE